MPRPPYEPTIQPGPVGKPTHLVLDENDNPVAASTAEGRDPARLVPLHSQFFDKPMRFAGRAAGFVEDVARERGRLWAIVRAEREASEYGGVDTPAGRIDTDEAAQARVARMIASLDLEAVGFTVEWTRADNSAVTLTALQARGMARAMFRHVAAVRGAAQRVRAALDAATTIDALRAVRPGAPALT